MPAANAAAECSIRPALNVVSAKLTSSYAGVAAPAPVIVTTVRSCRLTY
jgi:hypothetical protein